MINRAAPAVGVLGTLSDARGIELFVLVAPNFSPRRKDMALPRRPLGLRTVMLGLSARVKRSAIADLATTGRFMLAIIDGGLIAEGVFAPVARARASEDFVGVISDALDLAR